MIAIETATVAPRCSNLWPMISNTEPGFSPIVCVVLECFPLQIPYEKFIWNSISPNEYL